MVTFNEPKIHTWKKRHKQGKKYEDAKLRRPTNKSKRSSNCPAFPRERARVVSRPPLVDRRGLLRQIIHSAPLFPRRTEWLTVGRRLRTAQDLRTRYGQVGRKGLHTTAFSTIAITLCTRRRGPYTRKHAGHQPNAVLSAVTVPSVVKIGD